MDFKKSKTYKNLETALQGEALAHLKYQFYRSQLSNTSKDIEKHLDEIVHNEKEHGKIWFKLLHDGQIPSDDENLLDAIQGEQYEHIKMYPEFAQDAYDEGFYEIGNLFDAIAEIEGQHKDEFEEIRLNLQKDNLFKDKEECFWICLNCGHIYVGKEAPEVCPVCNHPQKYFVRD